MPRIIAQNRIPRVNIGNRGIVQRFVGSGAGQVVGFFDKMGANANFGLVGQPGSYQIGPYVFETRILLQMVGQGGGSSGAANNAGGSGGGATLNLFILKPGQSFVVNIPVAGVGNVDGLPTTTTLPDGRFVSAGGGGRGNGFGPPFAPGVGVGGDFNRRGGAGGQQGVNLGYGVGVGETGEFGGVGGGVTNTTPGGGGSGGFKDIFPDMRAGVGVIGGAQIPMGIPGGGSGGQSGNNGATSGGFLCIVTRF